MTAASVSLCLIVRNEEDCLADCLRSAADLVREIIVVDTGSTDRTREVAVAAGAKVIEFAWSDSFAAARNESLRHATGQWIFWLDADERLDEENRQQVRTLFAGLGDDNAAYTMTQQSELEASTYSTTRVDQVRLFRNHPQIRWDYRVHEQILPAVRAGGGELRRTDIVIHHAGFRDPVRQEAKVDRNLRLLLMEARERPEDAFILFNLGSVYLGRGQGEAALPLLQRSLSRSRPDDTIVPKLYALLTRCQHQLGRLPDALAVCRAGRQVCPDAVELLFWEGLLLRELGDAAGAAACLERVLETRSGTCFTGVDAGMHGYKARQCLAEIYRMQGRDDRAETQWRAVLAEQPRYAPARLGLAEVFVEQRRWAELEEVLDGLRDDPQAAAEVAFWRARGHLRQGRFDQARQLLEELLRQAPPALKPRILLSHVLLQEGKDWEAAEAALREVVKLDPRQAESWRNLVALLRQQERSAEAFAACQAGQGYCPDYGELILLEGLILYGRGDRRGAETCLVRWLNQYAVAPEPKNQAANRVSARHHLALIYHEQKRDREAEALWQALLKEQPGFLPAWLELGELLAEQGRWADLDRAVAYLEKWPNPAWEVKLLQARSQLARREFEVARGTLQEIIRQEPRALRPRLALGYTYLQEGKDWAAAERALRDILELAPDHAETRHNLAAVLERQRYRVGSPSVDATPGVAASAETAAPSDFVAQVVGRLAGG